MCLKMYLVPIGIVAVGLAFYFFVFDSLNQYQRQSVITILENGDNKNGVTLEQIRMQEELDKIRKSANADFIQNTISENINRISSYTNIEFNEQQDTNNATHTKDNLNKKQTTPSSKNHEPVRYTPYNPANTHIIPNNFNVNPNSPTSIKLDSNTNAFDIKSFTLFLYSNIDVGWAIPYSRHAKIYKLPSTNSKVIYTNKDIDKVQIVTLKNAWAKVRYMLENKKYVEGYMPINALKFKKM